jgi:hypothetical protein
MGKADFHRRWAARLLRRAAEAKDPTVRDQLSLMAADCLDKAARIELAGEEMTATHVAASAEVADDSEQPTDEPPPERENGA